jgi:hypothetical protein
MKRILQLTLSTLACAMIGVSVAAQIPVYGDEWIDYSRTYYKFKVAKEGMFRITRPALDAAGVPATVAGSHFILYRNGQEVPMYVSAENMGSNDYIEFAGRGADGSLDRELYADPAWQPNPHVSLFTDTAAYFLTYDNGGGHLRITQAINSIPVTPPAPEAYNWATVGNYYKNAITEGPSFDITFNPSGTSPNPGNPFFSPSFQNGEGLVAQQVALGNATSIVLATPNAVTAAVSAMLQVAITNRTYHTNPDLNITVNSNQVARVTWPSAETKQVSANIPAALLVVNNTIGLNPLVAGKSAYDIYGVAFASIKYPRNYDVAGLSYFSFKLDATGSNQYLEFSNVAGTARLYDITNNRWYAGDVTGSKTRFYLQPSTTERELVLATDGSAATLSPAKTIQFTNYALPANQGDYIIITHNKLMQPVNGVNPIEAYKQHRSSADGGLHKVQVADVADLYDQFAYGYETHPLSIRHFLESAYNKWTTKPVAVNIIGHGLQYEQYREYYSKPGTYTFPIVPTFGNPGSDVNFTTFGTDRRQKLQIGRISVWNSTEVANYLEKVRAYEAAMRNNGFPTAATDLWKKKVMHIAGAATTDELNNTLAPTLGAGKQIIEDTLLGAKVYSFFSNNAVPGTKIDQVDSLINGGLNMITYLGHASSTTLYYNLPEPETFNSVPRLPVFLALGCDVAQMFTATSAKTYSEKYTLATTAGAIAMLATDNYGYTDFLHDYLLAYYSSVAYKNYGGTVGQHTMLTHNKLYDDHCQSMDNTGNSYYTQIESQILNGDPALPVFAPAKPDYHISADGLATLPTNVTTSIDSFQLRIVSHNLGRVLKDSVQVKVEHRNPAGAMTTSRTYILYDLRNSDTSIVWMPVNPQTDIGLNRYTVKIDAQEKHDELNEANNTAELDVFVASDNLIPVYPYEFSIVHNQGVTLKASTLNPLRPMARYAMEIDTTTAFNSPLKQSVRINSPGGVIKWTPVLTMKDSTVYYWRCAFDSLVNGSLVWSGSSFIYLANGSDGWNQSHYFQYQQNGFNNMTLNNARKFQYKLRENLLEFYSSVANIPGEDNRILVNSSTIQRGGQSNAGIIQIAVFDSLSGITWKNRLGLPARPGTLPASDLTKGYHLVEFLTYSPAGRLAAIKYLDSIPDGNYVMFRNSFFQGSSANIFAENWKADATDPAFGGRSLYQTIKDLGFAKIDSFNRPMVFMYMFKKGRPDEFPAVDTFAPPGVVAKLAFSINALDNHGDLQSTIIGPAKEWKDLRWKMHAADIFARNDTANVHIYGITPSGAETKLYEGPDRDKSLSFISAAQYPKLRMEWRTRDTINVSAPQLDYWRVLYNPVPEAALNPALKFTFADSLQVGQQQTLSIAIENLTPLPMDSMLVSYKVINSNGVTMPLSGSPKRYRSLPGNDTLNATITFDPKEYPGANNLFVEVNPANDQPEQYHPNNLGYLPFHIGVDDRNPLLDVTFDGIHILNNDIVSARPLIKILLKDENNYLALDDTSLVKVKITGQQHPVVELPFDGVTCKFIPGQTGANGKNEAIVEINKEFEDDIYTLTVEGNDRTGNGAGTPNGNTAKASYRVSFEVINKATVTNVLNYPNPFSTATSFLFTITGSQIPSQFKIQILSVTGKVVREITKAELGPLHIGRNITEYKWDGRDQYGQLLGNGVYMYRVATSLNGERIEHRNSGGDRFFKNGYGKMYIMR